MSCVKDVPLAPVAKQNSRTCYQHLVLAMIKTCQVEIVV
jgi:hypothetical protein